MKILFIYIKSFFVPIKLNWDNTIFQKDKSVTGVYSYYSLLWFGKSYKLSKLIQFQKLDNTTMYHTKIYYCGDLFYQADLETTDDLKKISGKTFSTKSYCYQIQLPSYFNMLKYFFSK